MSLPVTTAEKYAKDHLKWKRLVNSKWAKALLGCAENIFLIHFSKILRELRERLYSGISLH